MALRRRMGRLERFAVRCALGVLDGAPADEPTGELIFCSRSGNVETLSALHRSIANAQLMSPMAFSGSVHNAAPGLVGQIRNERLSHTAIAAGSHTFAAGLVEAYTRLQLDECRDVTVIFADLFLPDVYAAFETETDAGVAVAMRVERADTLEGLPAATVEPGRKGVFAMLEKLREGASRISLEGLPWAMHAH
jgi:Beta-ketoacyl synthase, N-terminal domain